MKYSKLGRTGITVSRLGVGTVNFAWLTDEAESFAILDRALELGINLIDTSNNYNAGRTEELIGRWLAQGGGRREKIVLASKVFSAPNDWGSPDPEKRSGSWVGPNDRGLSARHIRSAVEASLKRLNTDHLDLYQMHHVDRGTPWEELWQAMDLLIAQGKIIYVGSSNFAGWHIARAQSIAERRGMLGLTSEQSVYNLLNRSIELEVAPACQALGIGLLTYSPLASGALGAPVQPGAQGRRSFIPPAMNEKTERYFEGCKALDLDPGRVAMAWVAHQSHVTSMIVGPRTRQQLEEAVASLSLSLDESTLEKLNGLFPGPGGPAPEAYAW